MRLNPKAVAPKATNHEGAVVNAANDVEVLERLVMTTMLYEDQFYTSGEAVAAQIAKLVEKLPADESIAVALKARHIGHLRHAPLFVLREVARKPKVKMLDTAIADVCDRPDMLTDFMALYWKDKKCSVSNPVKRGLASALNRFNEYQLQKYNRPNKIKLRDIARLVHPKPVSQTQADVFRRLLDDNLATPDTWEVALTQAHTEAEKRAVWTRLINENKLGGLALLRNLRNMLQVNVPIDLIRSAIANNTFNRVLPFQFFKASENAIQLEGSLDAAMIRSIEHLPKITGKTNVLVDVSGSMYGYGNASRSRYAAAAAILARELYTDARFFTFSNKLVEIPLRRGMALRDAIDASQPHSNTNLAEVIPALPPCERLIIITDEQAQHNVPSAAHNRCYILNVASYDTGVGYLRGYHHIHGVSNRVFDYMAYHENGAMLESDDE